WPLTLSTVRFSGPPPDLPLAKLLPEGTVKSALRITLTTPEGMPLSRLSLDTLSFFLSGADETATRLYELLFARCMGVVTTAGQNAGTNVRRLAEGALSTDAFDDARSMFPCANNAFAGYRLLHEYFAFPVRYLFFSVADLARSFVGETAGEITI